MSNQHPITPPPELVQQWWLQAQSEGGPGFQLAVHYVATQAAQWGADQELEACCEWLFREPVTHEIVGRDARYLDFELRAARRPKPPTLKEQALAELEILRIDANTHGLGFDAPAIRRALEALPND